MQIRLATENDRLAWDSYVQKHPEGTVFHLTNWKRVIDQAFGHSSHYLLASEGETLLGILPLFEIKSLLFGHFLVSVPFAELGGALADSSGAEEKLLARAAQIAGELGCDYLELKNRNPVPGLPAKDLYFNFSRELFPDPEENLLAIPRKSRAAVRKGISEGLLAEFGNHLLDDFYEVMAQSYHGLGTPIFPKGFFRKFLEVFGSQAQLMVVRSNKGVPVAAVLTFYFKDRVMPYYAGSVFAYRKQCPNDFMYWKLMEYGCAQGYKVFDFGRSKIDTGSFSFKKHWGFEPQPLSYQYHLVKSTELPNLSPTNPKYQRKIALWRKMPLALTKILGPPLAKYLG